MTNSARPRILHCVSHLALGGAERVAMTLIEALRGEFDFGVFAVRGLGDGATGQTLANQLQAWGVPLERGWRVPMRFGGVITGAVGLGGAVQRLRPDLIHLHTEIPEASYALMATLHPRWGRIPALRTIHNSVFWAFAPPLARWCNRRLAHLPAVGVSRGAVAALADMRRRSGLPPSEVAVPIVHNGIAAPATAPAPASMSTHGARRERSASEPIRLVFGGRFEPQKGTDLLPAILTATTLPAGRTAELTLFGSGQDEARLRAWAARPPVGWTIRVAAPVGNFRQRLNNYDLLIMPSRFEGLPLIAVEAAWAGLPVVGTDAEGCREVWPAGHPWVARAGDAASFAIQLSAALAATAQWPAVAARARAHAKTEFGLERMAAGYRELYHASLTPVLRRRN